MYLFLLVLNEFVLFFCMIFDDLGDLSSLCVDFYALCICWDYRFASILSCIFLNLFSSWLPGLVYGSL